MSLFFFVYFDEDVVDLVAQDLLFRLCLDYNFKISRIDLALDDFTGVLDLTKMLKKGHKRHFKGDFRNFRYGSSVIPDADVSDIRLRFYDKLAERLAKRFEVYKDLALKVNKAMFLETYNLEDLLEKEREALCDVKVLQNKEYVWQRYEIQIRREYAQLFLEEMVNDINKNNYCDMGLKTHQLIVSKLVFLSKPFIDKGKEYWQDFSKGVDVVNMYLERKVYSTIHEKARWLVKQVMPTYTLKELNIKNIL